MAAETQMLPLASWQAGTHEATLSLWLSQKEPQITKKQISLLPRNPPCPGSYQAVGTSLFTPTKDVGFSNQVRGPISLPDELGEKS